MHLYVSSKTPYTIQLFRLGFYGGVGARLMSVVAGNSPRYQGAYVHDLNPATPFDCDSCTASLKDEKGQETYIREANWICTDTVHFPVQWTSGIYLFKLTNSSGQQWLVPVVLRDDNTLADLVFQVPLNTDQAYNSWGGTSLYQDYSRSANADVAPGSVHSGQRLYRAYYVSWNRPFEQKFGSGNVLVWTYAMLYFLEEQGYNVTYTTNNAVAAGLTHLLNYKGFVSAGHDEYWSQAERARLEAAIALGVSAAFFGGNDMYRQVRNYPDFQGHANRRMAGYDNPRLDPVQSLGPSGVSLATGKWRDPHINYPEDNVLVSMYSAINYHNQNFIAKNTEHWVFKGTELDEGAVIPGILGYEVDAIFHPELLHVPGEQVTIIGESPFFNADNIPKRRIAVAAVRELAGSHNIVFNAGTLDWVFGLTSYHLPYNELNPIPVSAPLRQMTNNILQRIVTGTGPNNAVPIP